MSYVAKEQGWVGRQFNRKEDYRLTTGKGQYISDIVVSGMLDLVFVRSQHAHARIKQIDTSAAKAIPGVVAVVTGADLRNVIKPCRSPLSYPRYPRDTQRSGRLLSTK